VVLAAVMYASRRLDGGAVKAEGAA